MSGLLCLTWNNHYSSFLKLLSSLLLKESFSDATVVCHGKYFHVHQLVLSSCSKYFQDIFEQTKCKHPFIIIKDVKPTEFESLLSYMYKGEVNVSQEYLPDLIKAAEGLRIKGLAVPDDIPNTSNEKKKREFTESPSTTAKRKKITENGNKNGACNSTSMSQPETELHINKSTRCAPHERSLQFMQNNAEPNITVDPIECKKENLEESTQDSLDDPLQINTDVAITPNEIKVELSDTITYSEEMITESVLTPFSSGISSDGAQETTDDQFNSQSYWDGLEDKQQENETPLEISGMVPMPSEQTLHHQYAKSSDCLQVQGTSSLPIIPTSISDTFNWNLVQMSDSVISGSNESTFRCPKCPYECSKKYNLKSHYMYKHTKERPIGCEFCPFRCVLKSDLKRHLVRHTRRRESEQLVYR